jgi:hypothetical protein
LALTRRPPWSTTACDTRWSWRARAPSIAWRWAPTDGSSPRHR